MLTTTTDLTICSVETQARHPELYQYTTKSGLQGIVKSNTLWATCYRDLNDSTEVTLLREPLKSVIAPLFDETMSRRNRHLRRFYESTGGGAKMARDFVNSLYGSTFESKNNITAVEAFVTSFSTHAEDKPYEREHGLLSQWRAYGGGDGFCIVFDTPALGHLLAREFDARYWVHLNMEPVRYAVDEVPLDALFPKLVRAGADTLQQFLSGAKSPEMGLPEFLAGATLLKHKGFQEEREVRIVAIPGTAIQHKQMKREHADFPDRPPPTIHIRPENGRRYIPLLDGCNATLPIKYVIVGPSLNQAANAAHARELLGDAVPVTCSAIPWVPLGRG
jgi:hypothetical protein